VHEPSWLAKDHNFSERSCDVAAVIDEKGRLSSNIVTLNDKRTGTVFESRDEACILRHE
jgi:hypothetical protein